jgi:RNA polymerase sigma factor (sigma-70 family)
VYAFIRQRGQSPADAEDLTQGYFTVFFEKDYLRDFRPEAGRFRTFLRASVAHFVSNQRDRERALKRGGGQVKVPLDAATAEERLRLEPADRLTPETVFERQWAAAVLARCLERLRAEQADAVDGGRFEQLKPFLSGDAADGSYRAAARELGLTESAVRVAVHRMRRRFGRILREEIAQTLTDPGEVDGEIRWLLAVVRANG